MAVWPATLPPFYLGATETRQDGTIRTAMDAGPAKQRRRFSAVSRAITVQITLDATQRTAFDTFYSDTLGEGSDTFDANDPFGGSTAEFRFTAPPTYAYTGRIDSAARWYVVTLQLEVLP